MYAPISQPRLRFEVNLHIYSTHGRLVGFPSNASLGLLRVDELAECLMACLSAKHDVGGDGGCSWREVAPMGIVT